MLASCALLAVRFRAGPRLLLCNLERKTGCAMERYLLTYYLEAVAVNEVLRYSSARINTARPPILKHIDINCMQSNVYFSPVQWQ